MKNWHWLLLAWLVFFWHPIFVDRWFYSTADLLNENFSIWTFIGNELRVGRFPIYDPYFLGNHFIAVNWTAVFYPITLPLAYLGSFLSIDNRMYLIGMVSIFHIFIASLNMDYFLRYIGLSRLARLFGSIVFAYASFTIISVFSLTHVQSICWLPLLIAFFLQKRAILVSVALSLMILGGHPTEAIYALEMLSIWAFILGWKHIKILFKAVLFTFIVCLPQIIPTMLYFGHSVRSNATFYELTNLGSMPPFYPITLFIPHLFGGTGGVPEWGYLLGIYRSSVMFCYMGLIPIGLFIYSLFKHPKHKLWYTGITIAFGTLLMAMGKYSFVYLVVYKLGIPQFRNPSSWLIFFTFAVAMVSAIKYEEILNNNSVSRPSISK